MRTPGSPESLERRRKRALKLLGEGLLPVEVARKLGVDRRSVRYWRAAFEKRGEQGLAAKPVPGRPLKLDARGRKKLEKLLRRGAMTSGYPTDLWTCRRVAEVIRREFGVRYHEDHIGRLLRAMGWSPQKPERRARERDEAAIQRWVETDLPRIKKKPGA
jgi:transposase